MEIDDITPTLLSNTLRAWRAGDRVPTGVLALDALDRPPAVSPVEREIRLRELVESIVAEEAGRQRAAEELPIAHGDTRAELLAAVGRDFYGRNGELEAWSALYHRYLAPIPLRGKRCESWHVQHTAAFLADLKDVPLDAFAAQTSSNAKRVYNVAY